jgi:hypothetical protein
VKNIWNTTVKIKRYKIGFNDLIAEAKLTFESKTKIITKAKSMRYPQRDLTKNKKTII